MRNSEQIAEELRQRIRTGQLALGQVINQKQLAAELGVSRIPVREGLQALCSEGLVTLNHGKGATVVDLDQEDIADLYDLRLAVEPGLAPDVIAGLSPRDHRGLVEMSALMHRALEPADSDAELHRDRWSSLNHEFHTSMYIATERTHTVRVVLQLMELVEPYSRLYVHLLGGVQRATTEHDEMLTAIERRDADGLAEMVSTHLQGARDELLDERWWSQGRFMWPLQGDAAAARRPPAR